MTDNVSQIKEKLHVAEVLGSYIQLIPAGKNLKALCPFHKEKTPSFMVSPDREMWYCFGCAEGGDMFKFVMKFENLEFFEALKILAEKAGVEVVASASGGEAFRELYEINRIAKDFFGSNLHNTPSAHRDAAVKYLKERGLNLETIKEFEIGLAPTISDSLFRHLIAQKKSMYDIERAGVIFKSERGTYWDRFRSRLMFPLYNSFGKVIGFTGRILPSDAPVSGFDGAKYVNSSETPIFHKSKLLYGFHKSKNYIRDSRTAIVVEGQMDFLMMWQDGIKNVIASSGTALTEEHLQNLRRLADNLWLCFDADEAGQNAAERSIDLANALDFNVRLIEIGDGQKDPADVVLKFPGKMMEIVGRARGAMDWYFDRYLKNVSDIQMRKKGTRAILEKIKRVASPIEREHHLRNLSLRTNISELALKEEMGSIALNLPPFPAGNLPPLKTELSPEKNRRDKISERILALVYADSALKKEVAPVRNFLSEKYQILFDSLDEGGFKGVSPELSPDADLVGLKSSFITNAPEAELNILIRELRTEDLKNRREELRAKISELERMGDMAALSAAIKEFDLTSKELHNLH
jgi:DNA primase